MEEVRNQLRTDPLARPECPVDPGVLMTNQAIAFAPGSKRALVQNWFLWQGNQFCCPICQEIQICNPNDMWVNCCGVVF